MSGGMVLDNLILNVSNVSFEEYTSFISDLYLHIGTNHIQRYQGLRAREYHYNVLVGSGGGAAYIGYQHNSEKTSRKGFTLKMEFNPSKMTKEQSELRKVFFKAFGGHETLVKGGELALDVECSINSIIPISVTGRAQDRHKGTIYFGCRGKHGYLKIYNKKKELSEVQHIEIESENLTRIEFSFRFEKPCTVEEFRNVDLGMNKLYKIFILSDLDLSGVDPVVKACVYSYKNGFQDIKDFSRTYKNKIKKALEGSEEINLDRTFQSAKEKIILTINSYANKKQLMNVL